MNCPIELTSDLKAYFQARINKDSGTDCWLWAGSLNQATGYGTLSVRGKNFYAHRVALWLEGLFGKPTDQSLHSCDVRNCVNPSHLRWGTEQDNHNDSVNRGRVAHGEKIPNAKLTPAKVQEALQDRASGMLIREIARKHGVSRPTMSRALAGRTWKRSACTRQREELYVA